MEFRRRLADRAGPTASHTYTSAGTYTATFEVTDSAGASTTDTATITVVKQAVDQVGRDGGADRIATAILLSQRGFTWADTAVVVRADEFPDALSSSTLAAEVEGPVLLTASDELDTRVLAELARLGVSKVYLVGGPTALSESIETTLDGVTLDHERLSGPSRFETAAAVADEVVALGGQVDQAIIALGAHPDPSRAPWPDALSAGSLATVGRAPILLVNPDSVPEATSAALARILTEDADVWIAGGTVAIETPVETSLAAYSPTRLAGTDRYATSVAIVEEAVRQGATLNPMVVASGTNYPDALSAGPVAWHLGGVLLLVPPTDLADGDAALQSIASHNEAIDSLVVSGARSPSARPSSNSCACSSRTSDRAASPRRRPAVGPDRGCVRGAGRGRRGHDPFLTVSRPAPSPTSPHVDPAVAHVADAAVADLAERLDVPPDDITVAYAQPTTWGDTSLGCRSPASATRRC